MPEFSVWVEEGLLKWWIIIEKKDQSYHWTTPIEKSEGNDFLNFIIAEIVKDLVNHE